MKIWLQILNIDMQADIWVYWIQEEDGETYPAWNKYDQEKINFEYTVPWKLRKLIKK